MDSHDYRWEFRYPTEIARYGDAEAWARGIFEGPPLLVRILLAVGWRHLLRLRLGPRRSPELVAGWPIAERTPTAVTLLAESPLVAAANRTEVDDTQITWVTTVSYRRRLGRLLWALAAPLHQATIPRFLRGAARAIGKRAVLNPGREN